MLQARRNMAGAMSSGGRAIGSALGFHARHPPSLVLFLSARKGLEPLLLREVRTSPSLRDLTSPSDANFLLARGCSASGEPKDDVSSQRAKEAVRLQSVQGGVLVHGADWEAAARLCMYSRIAEAVWLRLGHSKDCATEERLEETLLEIRWSQFFPDPAILPLIPVRVASFASQLCNERRVRSIVRKALTQYAALHKEEIPPKTTAFLCDVQGTFNSADPSCLHASSSSSGTAERLSSSSCSPLSVPVRASAETVSWTPRLDSLGRRSQVALSPPSIPSSSETCSRGLSPELQSISRLLEALNFRLSVVLASDSLFVDLQLSPRLTPRPYAYLSRHVANARAYPFPPNLSPFPSPANSLSLRSAGHSNTSGTVPLCPETVEKSSLVVSSVSLSTGNRESEGSFEAHESAYDHSELPDSSRAAPTSPSTPFLTCSSSLPSASVSSSTGSRSCSARPSAPSLPGSPYLSTPSCSPVIRELLNQDFTGFTSTCRADPDVSPEWSLARVTQDVRSEEKRRQWEGQVSTDCAEEQGDESPAKSGRRRVVYVGSLYGTAEHVPVETEKFTQRHPDVEFASRSHDQPKLPQWKLSAFESLLQTLRKAERQSMRARLAAAERQDSVGINSGKLNEKPQGNTFLSLRRLSRTAGDQPHPPSSPTESVAALESLGASGPSFSSFSRSPELRLCSPASAPLQTAGAPSSALLHSHPAASPRLSNDSSPLLLGSPVSASTASSSPPHSGLTLPVEVELLRLRQLYCGRHVTAAHAAGFLPPAALTSSAGLAEAYEADDATAAAVALASGVRRAWKREADVVVWDPFCGDGGLLLEVALLLKEDLAVCPLGLVPSPLSLLCSRATGRVDGSATPGVALTHCQKGEGANAERKGFPLAEVPQESQAGVRSSSSEGGGLCSPATQGSVCQEAHYLLSPESASNCSDFSIAGCAPASSSLASSSSPLRKGIVTLVGSDERALLLQAARNRIRSFHYFYCGGAPPEDWHTDYRNQPLAAISRTLPPSSNARELGSLTQGQDTEDQREGEDEARSSSEWEERKMRAKLYVPDETTEWGSKALPFRISLLNAPFYQVAPFLKGAFVLTRMPGRREGEFIGSAHKKAILLYERFGHLIASRADWRAVYVLTRGSAFQHYSRLEWEEVLKWKDVSDQPLKLLRWTGRKRALYASTTAADREKALTQIDLRLDGCDE
ncbi:hypothetical protein CSUI_006068 [Cystoisospora suis]|uniref:Methyltransferase n=1 Tax=Cystoisospora suis TaxID=483139 RepID=A0A2C6KT14_9APIC|nr:hypothetical protein CSUI_006068 [Cystoisospora suis]